MSQGVGYREFASLNAAYITISIGSIPPHGKIPLLGIAFIPRRAQTQRYILVQLESFVALTCLLHRMIGGQFRLPPWLDPTAVSRADRSAIEDSFRVSLGISPLTNT